MKPCEKPLKSNPFTTYRDPKTGKWVVVNQEEKKEIDSGKYRFVANISIKSFEKHIESHIETVAA
ncbi:hypothetical protein PN499_21320 [Kamptonema animale CS-326]|jgi:hypothetical protein|uniref:hypothetical protein n=1 Tax=Kamptonema animale TaxID=92934 RepID=UPI00232FE97A|nr:hypothetical protein [Kamptonema animale]MDB9513741.1 hypothetical protein [Kamptonema animale CS-326]